MPETRCPRCARLYRKIVEIVEMGGRVRQLGLSLIAECVCGEKWPVSQLWEVRELQNSERDDR